MKVSRLFIIAFTATALMLAAISVWAATPQQGQASAPAVPTPAPAPVSVIVVVQCRQLVAMLLIDEHGGTHPADLEGMTPAQALALAQLVPSDHVVSVDVGCPDKSITV